MDSGQGAGMGVQAQVGQRKALSGTSFRGREGAPSPPVAAPCDALRWADGPAAGFTGRQERAWVPRGPNPGLLSFLSCLQTLGWTFSRVCRRAAQDEGTPGAGWPHSVGCREAGGCGEAHPGTLAAGAEPRRPGPVPGSHPVSAPAVAAQLGQVQQIQLRVHVPFR